MRLKTNNVLNYILLNNSTSANNYLQTNNRTIALSADENGVDGKVFLKTSNQNRVTVNGIGNVGIGTTAPTEKLHVDGNIRTSSSTGIGVGTDTVYSNSVNINNSGQYRIGNAEFISKSANDMNIYQGRMWVTNTGNVGIGTTAPIRELHVYSSTATINPSVLIQQAGTGNASLGFSLLGSTEYNMGIDKADNNKFKIHRNYPVGGDGNVFTITGGNDVGIGTESPAAKLHVAGEIRVNAGQPVMFDVANNIYAVAAQNQFRLYSGGNPAISITTAGRVGIGTTAPTEKLHITGGGAGNIRLDAGGTYYGTNIQAISSAGLKIGNDDFSGYAFFADNGNVGIGTTAPTQKLDVSGTIKVNTWGHQIALYGGDGSTLVGRLSYTGTTLRIQGNDGIRFEDTNGSNIHGVITDAGNFGIGTTAPSSTLHVAGTARIHSAANGAFGTLTLGSINHIVGDVNYINFKNNNNSWMMILNGNVGIGTTAPNSKVHISGTAMQQLRMETAGGPSSAGDTSGRIGDMAYDDDFFYIKTANGWGRVQLDFGF